MKSARRMLLESLKGHLALLEKFHPEAAALPVARRIKQYLRHALPVPVGVRTMSWPQKNETPC